MEKCKRCRMSVSCESNYDVRKACRGESGYTPPSELPSMAEIQKEAVRNRLNVIPSVTAAAKSLGVSKGVIYRMGVL